MALACSWAWFSHLYNEPCFLMLGAFNKMLLKMQRKHTALILTVVFL